MAFIFNVTLTITAIVLGYLLDALDDDQLNFLDRRIIANIQTACTRNRTGPPDRNEPVRRRSSTTIRDDVSDISELWEIRKGAIAQFILAVSDTQLVTG